MSTVSIKDSKDCIRGTAIEVFSDDELKTDKNVRQILFVLTEQLCRKTIESGKLKTYSIFLSGPIVCLFDADTEFGAVDCLVGVERIAFFDEQLFVQQLVGRAY